MTVAPITAAAPPAGAAQLRSNAAEDAALREVAQQFEQVFIAQMLKNAKVGEAKGAFAGGAGEDAFKSFLIDEYAAALSGAQAFGLADQIYAQLKQRAAPNAE